METLSIRFDSRRPQGCVRLPGSKSIGNRLAVMAYLRGESLSSANLSTADDTVLMQKLLDEVRVRRGAGSAGLAFHEPVCLDCGNAGTVIRFLTALLAFEPGLWLLDGCDRMRRRPIGPLAESLRSVGADIRYDGEAGYPPLLIQGMAASGVRTKVWTIDASLSSQYVSALMLVACRVPGGIRLRLTGDRSVSRPYVRMTAALLREAGVRIEESPDGAEYRVEGLPTAAMSRTVEPDWSSASYLYGLSALSEGGVVRLPGLRPDSCQGDRIVAEWCAAWGVESRFCADGLHIERRVCRRPDFVTLDFTDHPDLVQTMAVVCAASGVEARFTGVGTLRYKETDRLTAVITELERLKVKAVMCGENELYIAAGRIALPVDTVVRTYGDHRMALAFGMLSVLGTVTVEAPSVVRKSFDAYWRSLAALGAEMAFR